MYLSRHFNIKFVCLATDTPKRSLIQKKKHTQCMQLNACMHYYNCTDFWSTFDEFWLLNEHHTICFLSRISDNCIIRNKHKRFEKNLHSSATRISRKPPEAIGSQVKYIYCIHHQTFFRFHIYSVHISKYSYNLPSFLNNAPSSYIYIKGSKISKF